MKRISTDQLVPGMIIASDVYTFNDQLVLPKGLSLTDKSITRLRFYSIDTVKIVKESIPGENEIGHDSKKETTRKRYSERYKNSEVFNDFKKQFESTVFSIQNSMLDLVEHNKELDIQSILSQTLEVFKINDGNFDLFNMLHNLRSYDDDTFAHSVNVALICNIFAKWLKMSDQEVETATLAGLLHDVGKLKIPNNIIHKPARLTNEEYEVIKKHPIESYNILKSLPSINDHVKKAALMHHERCNGSGYPLGIMNSQIDPFAKIVSIVDVYEATTAPRVYRGALSPFEVIGLFQFEGIQKYDVLYIMTFLENIINTYLHYDVLLSDGTEGTIVFINKQDLSRPIIQVNNQFIDLSAYPTLSIQKVL